MHFKSKNYMKIIPYGKHKLMLFIDFIAINKDHITINRISFNSKKALMF
jgi:hypothetical protein